MADLFLLPTRNKNIKDAVLELQKLNEESKERESLFKKRKEELQKIINDYAEKNNLDEFGLNTDNGFYKVKPIINRKIIWNVDKLSDALDKEILNEVIEKKYSINDIDGLITYLKSCGVSPKKFKKFIDVEKTVNNKKIDELGQLGEIDIESLSGCYELQANFSYIKISELES